MLRILIADDHAIVRKGLVLLLCEKYPTAEIKDVGSGNELLDEVKANLWDIILLDISMPGRNGIETLRQLQISGIKTPVLMLSMYPEDQYAVRVLKAGAFGFINKGTATEELLTAVQAVLEGRKYISPAVAQRLGETLGVLPGHELLSNRELQILQLIASGKTISEIARELALSVNTISTYRARILEKLNLHNSAEITRYALDNNLA